MFKNTQLPPIWIFVLLAACAILIARQHAWVQRTDYVSALAGTDDVPRLRATDPAGGVLVAKHSLIIPEHNESSYHWILQTKQMFATGDTRVHRVSYDNAPLGREVVAASPYRWWIGLLAWADHASSGKSLDQSIERAAIWADPLLQFIFVVSATVLVAWTLGWLPATLLATGLVMFFPLASAFAPSAPDVRGVSALMTVASVLALVIGFKALDPRSGNFGNSAPRTGRSRARRWFALAGVISGLGAWISVSAGLPVVMAIFLSGIAAGWLMRPSKTRGEVQTCDCPPWRAWAVGGAMAMIAGYLAEYFPSHLRTWRFDTVNPLYGLAWLGAGELMEIAVGRACRSAPRKLSRDVALACSAMLPIAAIAFFISRSENGFLTRDLLWPRLTNLPDGAIAASLSAWVSRDGASAAVWATLLPLIISVVAIKFLFARDILPTQRAALVVAMGPAIVALGFGFQQLGWWTAVDGTLLALLVAITAWAPPPALRRWIFAMIAGVVVAAFFGGRQLVPTKLTGAEMPLTAAEAAQLIERDLAQWLEKRSDEKGAVVYAPPRETTALCFFGGLRGIGTFAPENREGFGTALAIAAANTMEETQALLQSRAVRFIVVPSWDPFFDEFAQRYLAKNFSNRTSLLVRELRAFNLPAWIRPLAYQMPVIPGFDHQSVLVFEIVDEQTPAVATSDLVEYLVEVGNLDKAAATADALRRFPGDAGALAAVALVQSAREDSAGFAKTAALLRTRVSTGADRFLPWERRVSVATVLAQDNQLELARTQVRRCVTDATAVRLRSLSAGALFRLVVLSQTFEIQFADPALRELAVDLLPAELRKRL